MPLAADSLNAKDIVMITGGPINRVMTEDSWGESHMITKQNDQYNGWVVEIQSVSIPFVIAKTVGLSTNPTILDTREWKFSTVSKNYVKIFTELMRELEDKANQERLREQTLFLPTLPELIMATINESDPEEPTDEELNAIEQEFAEGLIDEGGGIALEEDAEDTDDESPDVKGGPDDDDTN